MQLEGTWRRITPKILVISNGANSIESEGGCCLNTAVLSVPEVYSEAVSLPEAIRDPKLKQLYLLRHSGLGDALVALAGARAIKRAYPHLMVTLGTKSDYHPFLSLQNEVRIGSGRVKRSTGSRDQLIVDLNHFFELDHKPNTVKVNRVDRALGIFNLEHLTADFELTMPEAEVAAARKILKGDRPYIAVSVRRSELCGDCRTPHEELVAAVCRELSKDFGIYIVEGHDRVSWAEAIGAVVVPRIGLLETTAALSLCDVLLCPDSGAMWLGHVTARKTVMWAGPTPGGMKMNRHPLWPFGHRVIQTNDWINCPTCFEHEEACGWTHRCMKNADRERFVRESVAAVKELYGG